MTNFSPASILYDQDGNPVQVIDQALLVTHNPFPPLSTGVKVLPFRDLLKDGGGSSAMNVDGDATPVEFSITAPATNDRYITSVSFLILDAGASINEFANIGILGNGCRLFYNYGSGDTDLDSALKTNFDFVRLCQGAPAFGNGNAAFRVNNASDREEAYIPTLDFTKIAPPFGMLLRAGTTDKLSLEVRDDLSGADTFTATVYGFDRAP